MRRKILRLYMLPPPLSSTANISYYTQSNQSRDAKSCVSRPVPCRHAHAIIRCQQTHFSLVRRKILRLYMLPPPLSSTANISYYTQSNQSRDAKSCVSRPVPCRHAHAIIRCQQTHFSLVRRKILRLYMLPPPLSSTANISYYTQSNQSRDAKSCVSRPFHTNMRML